MDVEAAEIELVSVIYDYLSVDLQTRKVLSYNKIWTKHDSGWPVWVLKLLELHSPDDLDSLKPGSWVEVVIKDK
jgi:hypothetical protein